MSLFHSSNAPQVSFNLPLSKSYGFGNSPLATPLEKVKNGTIKFDRVIEEQSNGDDKVKLVESLMTLLKCNEKYWPDEELKRRAPKWGEHLSRICVKMPEAGYGSRTRTVILIDFDNKMDFYEETMLTHDPEGDWKRSHIFREF